GHAQKRWRQKAIVSDLEIPGGVGRARLTLNVNFNLNLRWFCLLIDNDRRFAVVDQCAIFKRAFPHFKRALHTGHKPKDTSFSCRKRGNSNIHHWMAKGHQTLTLNTRHRAQAHCSNVALRGNGADSAATSVGLRATGLRGRVRGDRLDWLKTERTKIGASNIKHISGYAPHQERRTY